MLIFCLLRVSFCAEHARRNALALHAQMKKTNTGPVGETLLCQLSSYAKTELGSQTPESSRSEASRILGKDLLSQSERGGKKLTKKLIWFSTVPWTYVALDSTILLLIHRQFGENSGLPCCSPSFLVLSSVCLGLLSWVWLFPSMLFLYLPSLLGKVISGNNNFELAFLSLWGHG